MSAVSQNNQLKIILAKVAYFGGHILLPFRISMAKAGILKSLPSPLHVTIFDIPGATGLTPKCGAELRKSDEPYLGFDIMATDF